LRYSAVISLGTLPSAMACETFGSDMAN
jgi:hypothetical protein